MQFFEALYLNFNFYGFIIGLAIIIGSWLVERQLQLNNEKILNKVFYKIGVLVFIFALSGARIWHVFTDFYLYKDSWVGVFSIWNGGLSIFGGVLGGIFGLVISTFILEELKFKSDQAQKQCYQKQIVVNSGRNLTPFVFSKHSHLVSGLKYIFRLIKYKTNFKNKKEIIKKLLDYSIFGLPVGQAIGRLGNYFNQELYGAPSSGFMKIFIDKEHRLSGFEQVEYYHPLFFYEMLATGLFASILYFMKKNMSQKLPKIGSGNLFILYVLYYSVIRFFLDFLRLDKTVLSMFSLGINQVFLLGLVLFIFGCSKFKLN